MKNQRKKTRLQVQRKEAILDKARALFWERGYERTSIKDIAYACSFEPANIYNYFRSKEQLLYEVLRQETKRIIGSIEDLEEDDVTSPVEKLRSFIKNHVNIALGSTVSSRLLCEIELRHLLPSHRKKIIELRNVYDRILRKIIHAGKDTGDFVDIDEKIAVYVIASMIVRSRIWFSPEGKLSADEIADFIFEFALNGLRKRTPAIDA